MAPPSNTDQVKESTQPWKKFITHPETKAETKDIKGGIRLLKERDDKAL